MSLAKVDRCFSTKAYRGSVAKSAPSDVTRTSRGSAVRSFPSSATRSSRGSVARADRTLATSAFRDLRIFTLSARPLPRAPRPQPIGCECSEISSAGADSGGGTGGGEGGGSSGDGGSDDGDGEADPPCLASFPLTANPILPPRPVSPLIPHLSWFPSALKIREALLLRLLYDLLKWSVWGIVAWLLWPE